MGPPDATKRGVYQTDGFSDNQNLPLLRNLSRKKLKMKKIFNLDSLNRQ